jgi:hypothetical protein
MAPKILQLTLQRTGEQCEKRFSTVQLPALAGIAGNEVVEVIHGATLNSKNSIYRKPD